MRDPPVVHIRFRLRLVAPIVELAADRVGQSGRHMDENIPQIISPARLQHQHLVTWVGAQPVRQHTPSRPAANDDRIELWVIHRASSYRYTNDAVEGCGEAKPPQESLF